MSKSSSSAATRVLVISARSDTFIHDLRQRFKNVEFMIVARPDEVADACQSVQPEVVLSCKSPQLPGPVHRPAVTTTSVKWIHVAGAGFDHLMPVQRHGLTITNSAGVLSEFMAQTVLGAILMLNFGLPRYLAQQRARVWQTQPWSGLRGKTALIVGLGNIGRRVAHHCQDLGMHVIGLRRGDRAVEHVDELITKSDLSAALSRTDLLCLHVPLTDETRGLIGTREFAALSPGALVVNTARGGVMDEQALLAALNSERVAGAYVDVFEQEPLPPESPLWDAPNLMMTPHVADSVSDYEARFAHFFADNLARWLAQQPLQNVVDPEAGY